MVFKLKKHTPLNRGCSIRQCPYEPNFDLLDVLKGVYSEFKFSEEFDPLVINFQIQRKKLPFFRPNDGKIICQIGRPKVIGPNYLRKETQQSNEEFPLCEIKKIGPQIVKYSTDNLANSLLMIYGISNYKDSTIGEQNELWSSQITNKYIPTLDKIIQILSSKLN